MNAELIEFLEPNMDSEPLYACMDRIAFHLFARAHGQRLDVGTPDPEGNWGYEWEVEDSV